MTEFDFTLVLGGVDVGDSGVLNALFEAGCDDATFGEIDGVAYADFTRQAQSATQAIWSAIHDIEASVSGARVVRVEPDDLVTAAEIAKRLGRSREGVRLLIAGVRGPGGFPPPVSHLKGRGRLWRWSEVGEWTASALRIEAEGTGPATLVAALNDALDLRRLAPKLEHTEDRELVAALLEDLSRTAPGSLHRLSAS